MNWEFLISFYATFAPMAVPNQLIWKAHVLELFTVSCEPPGCILLCRHEVRPLSRRENPEEGHQGRLRGHIATVSIRACYHIIVCALNEPAGLGRPECKYWPCYRHAWPSFGCAVKGC